MMKNANFLNTILYKLIKIKLASFDKWLQWKELKKKKIFLQLDQATITVQIGAHFFYFYNRTIKEQSKSKNKSVIYLIFHIYYPPYLAIHGSSCWCVMMGEGKRISMDPPFVSLKDVTELSNSTVWNLTEARVHSLLKIDRDHWLKPLFAVPGDSPKMYYLCKE